jgi:hypothetical protein
MNTSINEDFTNIRPATRALKQISKARLSEGKGHYEGTHHCALLMPDPNCVDMPSALLKDTVLQPAFCYQIPGPRPVKTKAKKGSEPVSSDPLVSWKIWCRHEESNHGPTDYKSFLQPRSGAACSNILLENH